MKFNTNPSIQISSLSQVFKYIKRGGKYVTLKVRRETGDLIKLHKIESEINQDNFVNQIERDALRRDLMCKEIAASTIKNNEVTS